MMKEDLHHPDHPTGFAGLSSLLLGRTGPEGVGPGPPGSRTMSEFLHAHQGRPHSPQHKDGGSNKRNHSPNKSQANDPLSHRIIEKRRRDRMNNCLADLSRLIPTYYTKKGRGRIEKTEIIEMAIKYMKHLKAHECQQIETCEMSMGEVSMDQKEEPTEGPPEPLRPPNKTDLYHMGYQDCINESMHFLNESEGLYPGDSLCVRLLNHLNKHQNDLMGGDVSYSRATGASSSSSGYHANNSSACSSSDGNGNGSANTSDNKDTDITEESAYRSDDHPVSEDRDDNSNRHDSSQLREMLQQQSSHYLGGYDNSPEFTSGSYSQGLSSNTSSSGDDNGTRLYKFKSNMKHRFTTDLEHTVQGSSRKKRRDSESSCGNYTEDYEKDCGTKNSPLLEKSSKKSIKEEIIPSSPDNVPIFALNKNGSFYIPLTIDYALIAKGMLRVSETAPVLHPVSIFVNFSVPSSNSCLVKQGPNDPPQNLKKLPNILRDEEINTRLSPQDHPQDMCRDSQLSNQSYNESNKSMELRQGEHLPQDHRELREHKEPHTKNYQLPQEQRDVREHREQLHFQEQYNLSQSRVRREPRQSHQEFIEKNMYSNSSSYSRTTNPNWLQHMKSSTNYS